VRGASADRAAGYGARAGAEKHVSEPSVTHFAPQYAACQGADRCPVAVGAPSRAARTPDVALIIAAVAVGVEIAP